MRARSSTDSAARTPTKTRIGSIASGPLAPGSIAPGPLAPGPLAPGPIARTARGGPDRGRSHLVRRDRRAGEARALEAAGHGRGGREPALGRVLGQARAARARALLQLLPAGQRGHARNADRDERARAVERHGSASRGDRADEPTDP